MQKELENLELNKARFNFPLYDKCLKYKLFKEHRTRLQKINKSLQEEQKRNLIGFSNNMEIKLIIIFMIF